MYVSRALGRSFVHLTRTMVRPGRLRDIHGTWATSRLASMVSWLAKVWREFVDAEAVGRAEVGVVGRVAEAAGPTSTR